MAIDVKRYIEKREKKLVVLSKIGKAAVASWNIYDPETGVELDPVVEAIGLDNLKETRKQAVDLLAGIDALIADIEALGVVSNPVLDEPK